MSGNWIACAGRRRLTTASTEKTKYVSCCGRGDASTAAKSASVVLKSKTTDADQRIFLSFAYTHRERERERGRARGIYIFFRFLFFSTGRWSEVWSRLFTLLGAAQDFCDRLPAAERPLTADTWPPRVASRCDRVSVAKCRPSSVTTAVPR